MYKKVRMCYILMSVYIHTHVQYIGTHIYVYKVSLEVPKRYGDRELWLARPGHVFHMGHIFLQPCVSPKESERKGCWKMWPAHYIHSLFCVPSTLVHSCVKAWIIHWLYSIPVPVPSQQFLGKGDCDFIALVALVHWLLLWRGWG